MVAAAERERCPRIFEAGNPDGSSRCSLKHHEKLSHLATDFAELIEPRREDPHGRGRLVVGDDNGRIAVDRQLDLPFEGATSGSLQESLLKRLGLSEAKCDRTPRGLELYGSSVRHHPTLIHAWLPPRRSFCNASGAI